MLWTFLKLILKFLHIVCDIHQLDLEDKKENKPKQPQNKKDIEIVGLVWATKRFVFTRSGSISRTCWRFPSFLEHIC